MALSPDLFKRLSRLNRDLVRRALTTGDHLATSGGPAAPDPGPAPDAARLETVIPGEECEVGGGRCYRVRRRAGDFGAAPGGGAGPDEGGGFLARYRRVFLGAGRARAPGDLPEALRLLALADPESTTYLDIETCGLAGEPVFLVGLLRLREGDLRVDQWLARDYAEERALLTALWRELASARCLVTFNGKTFDVPFVAARSAVVGLFPPPPVPAHVDLLHEARRRWKRELPNCRLQTLEAIVCGRRRFGDIPGCDIPAAYHDFVRACRADDPARRLRSLRCMQAVLHHNALDLVTMADLAARLLAGEA